MTQEIAKVENKELALGADLPELPAFKKREVVSSDIKIPYLALMQGSSQKVKKERIAQVGQILESTENKVVGDSKTPLLIVPFHSIDTWAIYETEELPTGDIKKIYRRMEPRTITQGVRWDFKENGKNMVRDACKTIYCLLLEDLKRGDVIPYSLLLRKMSVKFAGEQFETIYTKLEGRGQFIFSKVFSVTSRDQVSKKDSSKDYLVYQMQVASENGQDMLTPMNYQKIAYQQQQRIIATLDMKHVGSEIALDEEEPSTSSNYKETVGADGKVAY